MSTENLGKLRGGFAHRLRSLRKAKGWTQEDLAKKLDVSNGSVGYWEVGQTMPRPMVLKKIAALFETDVEVLLGEKSPNLDLREEATEGYSGKKTANPTSAFSWMELGTLRRMLVDLANRLTKSAPHEAKHILGNIAEVVNELQSREITDPDRPGSTGGSPKNPDLAETIVESALGTPENPGRAGYQKSDKAV